MSPYAFYVWTAYGISFAGLAAAIVLTWTGRRRARARLAALEERT